jgi:L-amino acid N-acyltransferase YncA
MNIRMRTATVADTAQIYKIWREGSAISLGAELPSEHDYEPYFRERIAAQDDTFKYFVAEDEAGTILGWVSFTPFRSNPVVREAMAELSAYVRPDVVRGGVVSKLVQYAFTCAERTPLLYVNAFISCQNEPAMVAALANGFLFVGSFPQSPKSSAPPLVYMTRVIAKPKD